MIFEKANAIKDDIIKIRRDLHQIPELGLSTPKTKAYIKKELEALGLEIKEYGESGLSALIKGREEGKTILLRADMDALPMKENSGLEFEAKGDAAHTCGHDLHSSMLLGAARLLVERKDEFKGNIKLMFQPAEEIFKGSEMMIEEGILEDPKVDAALALHTELQGEPGTIYYNEGYMTTSCDNFKITITGKGGHGAYPHTTIDPIHVGVMLYLSFGELVSREVPPSEVVTLTFGQFSGGSNSNIIPEIVEMQGTMRSYSPEVREKLKKRMLEIVEGLAITTGAKIDLDFFAGVPSTYSDPDLTREFIEILKENVPELKLVGDHRIMASEDMANVSVKVPTVYLMLDSKTAGNDFSHHNPAVNFNEDAIPYGISTFVAIAINYLNNN
ncbi:MAG: M20 family metallopeptidase [Ezakiella sp.]|nr:M20 family metallopeptidase [Ezakiella sp.]